MFEKPEGIENCRIWIDGCFDFAHHGHAGAMLQARQLGKELYVGVHSDEEILANKGPTVMTLEERLTAVDACKWSTRAIANAPYVTDPKVMDEYDCKYVVHGDDITTDANGEDCYQLVKDLGRFVVVERTPNISTTDLVGRMLLMSKNHHYPDLNKNWKKLLTEGNLDRFRKYATDETGLNLGSIVWLNTVDGLNVIVEPKRGEFDANQKLVYIDGGFDLFHPGHIEALKTAYQKAREFSGKVIVGIHDDLTVNQYKGLNYPIMNIFERSLCVLQCGYVDGIVLNAPYIPTMDFLSKLGNVIKVYHGPTEIDADEVYNKVKQEFEFLPKHKYDNINTEVIVNRVLKNKAAYEERQKKKGWKANIEKVLEANERNLREKSRAG
ncbi:MUQ1 [Candida oxycetoniae]|uniref:ethanolamine-phosphate cytidylyltransferase n=1 Tax=Candida oxycetoniae TaxID=497107 RepID=A0AAI9SSG3_9ASCO|nr:MUQ1 [Candida oxycetoniae]KAI3402369.1 MUQ1 [Candida oxycetoniae]